MSSVETVRQVAVATLSRNHTDNAETLSESWLVHNGFVIGRSFKSGRATAIWFFESDELKIRGQDGTLLDVIDLETVKQAA